MPTAGDYCGSFWDGPYSSPVVDAYATASAALVEKSTGQSPGHLRGWTILESERVDGPAYGNGRTVVGYPEPPDEPDWVAHDLAGSAVLINGVDFAVSDGYVWFNSDPLALATVRRLVWADGKPVEAADLFYAVATAPDAPEPDSATYDALTRAIALACDSPCALCNEVVEGVWRGWDGEWRVVTDLNTYRLTNDDVPPLEAGFAVVAGQPLGSAWKLTCLGPSKPNLPHLTTPPAYHQGVTVGGITWYDETTPLIVDVVDGRTRVRWALGGSQEDVDAFWDASHATGTAPGATSLAQAMDVRSEPNAKDPGPESLPTSVNPLEFICRELFAGNAYALVVRPERCGPGAAADRDASVGDSAGPYVAVFDYEGEIPALARNTPT